MKSQTLILIALMFSSTFAQLATDPITLTVGEYADTQRSFTIGEDSDQCGFQRGDGTGNDDDNPVPVIYTTGGGSGVECKAKGLVVVGSYLWAVYLSDLQLITADNSRSESATNTEYSTLRTAIDDTVYAVRVDTSLGENLGKFTQGYMIGTKDSAGAWAGITDVTAAAACRHYLVLTVDTAAGEVLTDEAGVATTVDGTGAQLAINTRTGKWTAYAASVTNVCTQIEAIPEEEEEEENSASILSIVALAALGVVAI